MKKLFVCGGNCYECSEIKRCPMKGHLDDGLKEDLKKGPGGEKRIERYEAIKKMSGDPYFMAFGMNDFIANLIEKIKKEKANCGIVVRSEIRGRLLDFFLNEVGINSENFDPRDQTLNEIKKSFDIISDKVVAMTEGKCNKLFCHDCCIIHSYGGETTKI